MADEARLPGVETGTDEKPIVLHVDADCFYAACERLREPALRGEPVVVGMGYEPGESVGAVATASYEARAFGVESAMAISQAVERLPRRATADSDDGLERSETGFYRPVDIEYYESVSEDVQAILHESADVVREVSIDEAYLDVTDRTEWAVAEGFARHVKERIQREVGVVVSIGVAPSMSAAKIASDHDKPDGLTVVEPGDVSDFLAPLDVAELHGVGPVTARELRSMGLETAGDVADADPAELEDQFGERGRELVEYARGEDDRPVTPRGLPKSFSRESAFASPVTDWEAKRETLETLAAAVADRATREGALYRTVGVKAVLPPYDVNTRERSLSGPIDDADLVVDIARDLFTEFADDRVRKLGVKVANLEFGAADQAKLDGWEDATASPPDSRSAPSRADARDSTPSDATAGSVSSEGPVEEHAADQRTLDELDASSAGSGGRASRSSSDETTDDDGAAIGTAVDTHSSTTTDDARLLTLTDFGSWTDAEGVTSDEGWAHRKNPVRPPAERVDPAQTTMWDFLDENPP
ncbi:nucleotidyltransferase/DNA polymerase involved in DNA repair [Halovivax ruber XH-70]|uniref:DNA polymerase IV n=1 Tax=Halovivax ruber (strain DSM 18193 / JCM 13892 / XH-70) TaxID=797302 RepID=L0IDI2_HALRX|nr:DNA polymerase IV [Halovivax ruber]AGB16032.1 nucleotidyltransferase/DNA polymerase involved in DNA repair [Halovivax ruber XH-70]